VRKSTLPASYRILSADRDKHLLPIAQIVSDQFAGGKYVDEISRQYIGNCHYDFDATRLGWKGKKLVHHWGVWGYPMRVGSAQLKTAGIGAVVTREEHRGRGLMHAAALESISAMRELGYDLSVLRGRHYVKYGYARGWNYVTYRLTREEVSAFDADSEYQPLGPTHMDDITTLYNSSHENFCGTAVRPTYRMLADGDMGAYGWFEDGELIGYVRAVPTDDKKVLQCLEAAGDVKKGFAVLASLFKQGEYDSLAFFTMHQDHPMLQRLRKGACILENKYFDISGWRVRLVNLHSVLKKLCPLLEARLQNSHFDDWCGELALLGDEEKADLKIHKGKVQVEDHSKSRHNLNAGSALVRFLIGSDDAEEVVRQEGIQCTGTALELAKVFFPNLHPMLSHWDEF